MTHAKANALIVFLVLIAAANVLLFTLTESNTATESQLDTGLHAACYRTGILRWSLNSDEIEEANRAHRSKVKFLPQTDCELAVDFPERYSPPLPINISLPAARRLNKRPMTPRELRQSDGSGNIP